MLSYRFPRTPVLLASLFVSVSLLQGCAEEANQTASQATQTVIRPVKLYSVGAPKEAPNRTLAGTIQASDQADLSFRVGGKVAEVNVDAGDEVSAGDIIATLDKTQLQLAADSAKAQLQRANAVLAEAQRKYTANKELVKRGVISRISFENIVATLKSATADADAARASHERALKDLDYAVLQAPFSGLIASRNVEPFTNVTAGQSLFQIAKQGQREVVVRMPLSTLRYINQDSPVRVTPLIADQLSLGDAPAYEGVIHQIGSRSEAGNAVTMKVLLQGNVAELRDGMAAEVRFNLSYQDSGHLTVPFSAIVAGDQADTGYVFKYQQDEQNVTKVEVQLIAPRDQGVEVSGELLAGDQVVAAGAQFLHEGQQVTPFKAVQ